MVDRPYFMDNKDWYKFDFKKKQYVLTDKAPEKAEQSLKEYYADVNRRNMGGKDG